MIRTCTILFLLAALGVGPASAQLPDSLSNVGRIYVLTTMPGDAVYSRYGHTAIRVHDRTLGLDVTFNYGVFDFQAPGFVRNFIGGRLDYYLDFSSTRRAIQGARVQGRTVRQQLLDISREHRDAIYSALLVNALPENRVYRYDFLLDNCATRPLDLVAAALGEAAIWDSTTATGKSFRQMLDPYHAGSPEIDLGTDLIMGAGIDRTVTAREEAFLPLRLEAILNAAQVHDQYGRRPLVLVHDTLSWSPRPAMPEPAVPWPLVFGILAGVAAVLPVLFRSRPANRLARLDRVVLIALGLLGSILFYLGAFTDHHVTEANWNLLWALPTHLLVGIGAGLLSRRLLGGYLLVSAIAAALSLTGGFLLPQPLPSALVPVVLVVAIRMGLAGRTLGRA